MIRYTTPTVTLTVNGIGNLDLSAAEEVVVTLIQGETQYDKTGSDLEIDGNKISFVLSEAETAALAADVSTLVQVNWTWQNDDESLGRAATNIIRIPIGKQLYQEAMTE